MRLLIASYNIHKCIGGVDRRYDPARVCDAVGSPTPDILLLQEVDEGARRSRRHRQVDVLGDLFGLPHRAFFPNVAVRGGGHYGNAILSRFPITEVVNIDVTVPGTKRRSVLHACVRVRGAGSGRPPRALHVFNLHLGLTHHLRVAQMREAAVDAGYRAPTENRKPTIAKIRGICMGGGLGRQRPVAGFSCGGLGQARRLGGGWVGALVL